MTQFYSSVKAVWTAIIKVFHLIFLLGNQHIPTVHLYIDNWKQKEKC